MKRTTLTEVARLAGVSTTTASMVLSGKGEEVRIAPTTAARVQAAALELDYSPNLLVHSLQSGTSGILAFFSAFRVVNDGDLYMDRLSHALERAAGSKGYDLLIHCAYDRTPEETYQAINGGRADGLLLFAPHPNDPMLPPMRRSRLPCVLLNTRDPEGVLSSVKEDFESGMRQVAEALVANGHRRVVSLHTGQHEPPDALERIATLDRALQSFGIVGEEPSSVDVQPRIKEALREIFARRNPPTALFCCRDRIAYKVLDDLETLGIRVPEEVSVIGYDGIRWPSESRHRLATVSVDLNAQATAAVDLLIDRSSKRQEITVTTDFNPGTTLGPAPLRPPFIPNSSHRPLTERYERN